MSMTDEQLNAALENSPAPRITKELIAARIARVDYYVLPDSTVTVCNIRLDNGYSVRGESACVCAENFDHAIGERMAYDDAFRRLWPLFGFMLAEDRYRS